MPATDAMRLPTGPMYRQRSALACCWLNVVVCAAAELAMATIERQKARARMENPEEGQLDLARIGRLRQLTYASPGWLRGALNRMLRMKTGPSRPISISRRPAP